jgi:uncharacterized protein DUF4383
VRRDFAQWAAALVGASFLLIGLLGLLPGVTTRHDHLTFAGDGSDAMLVGLFRVSILHDLVHLALGAAGLACSSSHRAATRFLTGLGIASLALWALGVSGAADWLPVNAADNWLHLAFGAGALALGYRAAAGAAVPAPVPSRL